MKIYMQEGDSLTLELPNNVFASICVLHAEDSESLPELDIQFSKLLTSNCFGPELSKPEVVDLPNSGAVAHGVKQISLPLES